MNNKMEIYTDLLNQLRKSYTGILDKLEKTYIAKNSDYGDSVGDTYEKFGEVSFLIRITDKYNRINNLIDSEAQVTDEKLEDTILDMANYCLLWLVEMENKRMNIEKLQVTNKPSNDDKVSDEIVKMIQDNLNDLSEDEFDSLLVVLDIMGADYQLITKEIKDKTGRVNLIMNVAYLITLQQAICAVKYCKE